MTKKTYRTFSLKGLNIFLRDANNRRVEIVFRGGIQVDSTSRYSTTDEFVQEALEKSSGFNRDYYLESEQAVVDPEAVVPEKVEKPAAKEPEKVLTDVKDSRRFKNIIELRNAMAELGFKDVDKMNYLQCKAAAAKEGYDFQIKK